MANVAGTIMEVEGMTLSIGDAASPEVFTAIAGVKDIPKIKKSKSRRDRTETNDTQVEIYPGLSQAEEFTATLIFYVENTQHELLWTAQGDEVARNFRIYGSDSPATYWPFTARVFDITTPGGGVDSDATMDVTFICSTNTDRTDP